MPYERDANEYSYQRVKEICGNTLELQDLYHHWISKKKMKSEELNKLFQDIEKAIHLI